MLHKSGELSAGLYSEAVITELALAKVLRAVTAAAASSMSYPDFSPVVGSDFSGAKETIIISDRRDSKPLLEVGLTITQAGEVKAFFFGGECHNDRRPVFSADVLSDAAFSAETDSSYLNNGDIDDGHTLKTFSRRAINAAAETWMRRRKKPVSA